MDLLFLFVTGTVTNTQLTIIVIYKCFCNEFYIENLPKSLQKKLYNIIKW